MGHILLLASDRTWDMLPGLLRAHLANPDKPSADQALPPGAVLSPNTALDLARKHSGARILIADLRCSAALARLHEAGYVAERAGNRIYGGDATPHEVSALAGDTIVERLLAWSATEAEAQQLLPTRRAQRWERDGWAGLTAAGIPWREAQALSPVKEHWPGRGRAEPLLVRRELDDLTLAIIDTNSPHASEAADVAELLRLLKGRADVGKADCARHRVQACPANADSHDYEQVRCRNEPLQLRPVLLLHQQAGKQGSVHTGAIEYLGARAHLPWLARLLADPALTASFDLRLTIGRYRARLWAQPRAGADAAQVDALISRLLEVVLVTGRPLREYSCTFYLPLDLYLDEELLSPDKAKPATLAPPAPVEPHRVAGAAEAAQQLQAVINSADQEKNLACRLSRAQFGPDDDVLRDGAVTGEQLTEAQAILYFLPELQARLFDADPIKADGVRHWRLPRVELTGAKLIVTLDPDPRAEPHRQTHEIAAAVQDISLFGYTNNLFALAIRVGFTDSEARQARCFSGTQDNWWHALFGWPSSPGRGWGVGDSDEGACQAPDPHALQIERWLAFTKGARLLRSAFAQQSVEKKIQDVKLVLGDADAVFHREAFSPVVEALLIKLTGWRFADPTDRRRLQQLRDDRMVVNLAYALAGPPPSADPAARDAMQRLFSLALFVDRGADGAASQGGYAYDRDFVLGQLGECVNRRWAGLGSLYGSTNYSQVALGFGDYFAGPVARMHVPEIHGRLLLLVLLHDLTLTWFDRCITRITHDLANLDATATADSKPLQRAGAHIAAFQQRFIRFTNDHWFRTVTTQTQGLETHRLMTRAFGLDDKYQLVKDKIERFHDTIGQLRDRAMAEASHRQAQLGTALGRWGPPLALAALLLGVLAIPAHTESTPNALETYDLVRHKLRTLELGAFLRANWNFVTAAGVLAVAVAVWLVKRPRR
ncbi:hypothetical protein CKO31_19780 [Thiohalocapsa halophila]|uniref:Uncharacterized protein n=1 Tax=Thiohalocapsa halophila TaxID=69359 RepID=A0ABS1CN78_9GAMM|nr:hypothetical protein [Thiohalocapsa halophila]MBK1632949.1 hypothetical protein [Thiohalocapsa halophila]